MGAAAPWGAYREAELSGLGYEGAMYGVNLAVFRQGAHIADCSFDFRASEAACREQADALSRDAGLLQRAVAEHVGADPSEPGTEVEVSVEAAQVGDGGISDSEFEPVGFWHVEDGGGLARGRF